MATWAHGTVVLYALGGSVVALGQSIVAFDRVEVGYVGRVVEDTRKKRKDSSKYERRSEVAKFLVSR